MGDPKVYFGERVAASYDDLHGIAGLRLRDHWFGWNHEPFTTGKHSRTLVVRHRRTRELAEVGGHVGYHVVAPWRRQGHATRMLAAGLVECHRLGISRVLLTCDPSNEPSRKVILVNGGEPDGQTGSEDRFWIRLDPSRNA